MATVPARLTDRAAADGFCRVFGLLRPVGHALLGQVRRLSQLG